MLTIGCSIKSCVPYLHTFWYRKYVKWSLSSCKRVGKSGLRMLSAIARVKSSTNQRRLYWYMGSMDARSVTQKYSKLA